MDELIRASLDYIAVLLERRSIQIMQISTVQLSEIEIVVLALLSLIVILLIVLFTRINKKFNELDYKSD